MTDAKHTPGPWQAEAAVDMSGFETGKLWIIMGNQPCAYDFDRAADAQLASAAPDLLVACEALKAEFEKFARYGSPIALKANDALYAAHRAIAKATGAA